MVRVFTSFSAVEAQMIRSRLEAAGIHCVVANEIASLSTEGGSMATGGIDVQTAPEDAAQALEIVESMRSGSGSEE